MSSSVRLGQLYTCVKFSALVMVLVVMITILCNSLRGSPLASTSSPGVLHTRIDFLYTNAEQVGLDRALGEHEPPACLQGRRCGAGTTFVVDMHDVSDGVYVLVPSGHAQHGVMRAARVRPLVDGEKFLVLSSEQLHTVKPREARVDSESPSRFMFSPGSALTVSTSALKPGLGGGEVATVPHLGQEVDRLVLVADSGARRIDVSAVVQTGGLFFLDVANVHPDPAELSFGPDQKVLVPGHTCLSLVLFNGVRLDRTM